MPARSNGRDVDKGVRLSVVAADEAEALHRVEELDGAAGLLAGQLALGAAAVAAATTETTAAAGAAAILTGRALGDRHRLALDLEVGRRDAAAAIHQREFQRLPFGKAGEARLLHGGDVNKHVFAAIVADHKAEALLRIEELNDTLALADDLGRHAATTTAAAATEAAATAAAEAATTAAATESAATAAVAAAATAAIAATAAAIAAAAAAITTAAAAAVTTAAAAAILEAATEAVVAAAKTVALVSAAPAAFTATPSVENHAVLIFPAPETVLEPTRWATRNGFGAKHWRTVRVP
jgi:hypothetical protein